MTLERRGYSLHWWVDLWSPLWREVDFFKPRTWQGRHTQLVCYSWLPSLNCFNINIKNIRWLQERTEEEWQHHVDLLSSSHQLGHWIDIKHQFWSCCEGEKKPHRTIVSQLKTKNTLGDDMTGKTPQHLVNHLILKKMKSINLPVIRWRLHCLNPEAPTHHFPYWWLVLLLTLNFVFWSSFLLCQPGGSPIHTHQLHLRQYHYHYHWNQIKGPN